MRIKGIIQVKERCYKFEYINQDFFTINQNLNRKFQEIDYTEKEIEAEEARKFKDVLDNIEGKKIKLPKES